MTEKERIGFDVEGVILCLGFKCDYIHGFKGWMFMS